MFPIEEYRNMIAEFHDRLRAIDETVAKVRLSEETWSLVEIVGHLVDSASNNHQRFVRLQTGHLQSFPGYGAEEWVGIQSYRDAEWLQVVELWHLYNRHLLHVIEHTDEESLGNEWTSGNDRVTLEWLVRDYFRHLRHHIEHFTNREADVRESLANG